MCSSIRSSFAFSLLTEIFTENSEKSTWLYFETHHGKDPMDGKVDIVINMVCRKVLFDSTIINIPKQFAEFANILDTISCLSLPNRARSCQWMHSHTWHHLNAVQTYRSHGVPCNRFLLDFQKRTPFWATVRFFLRSQRKWRWRQYMLPLSERVYRFATNGFTKSAFTFDRIVDYF